MYTETRVFSIQIFRTLFKDTIARAKTSFHPRKDSKRFLFLVFKICDEKISYLQ